MMEQLVDKIYSVYTEQLKDKKYNNEDSIITLEQQDDGKWFVTDIKDAKQGDVYKRQGLERVFLKCKLRLIVMSLQSPKKVAMRFGLEYQEVHLPIRD